MILTCEFVRRFDERSGADKILVSVDPPVAKQTYGSATELRQFVLAPRHEGASLYPDVSEWPCYVHMCVPKEDGDWEHGPLRILDWGMIERPSSGQP
jgi:hypothetical protein